MLVKILEDNQTTIMECSTFKIENIEGKGMLFLDGTHRLTYDPDGDPPYILIMNDEGKTVDTIQYRKHQR